MAHREILGLGFARYYRVTMGRTIGSKPLKRPTPDIHEVAKAQRLEHFLGKGDQKLRL